MGACVGRTAHRGVVRVHHVSESGQEQLALRGHRDGQDERHAERPERHESRADPERRLARQDPLCRSPADPTDAPPDARLGVPPGAQLGVLPSAPPDALRSFPDAFPDDALPDAARDAPPDARPDVPPSAQFDAFLPGAPADAMCFPPDALPDDVLPDAAPDAPPDAPPDARPDVPASAQLDALPGAPPDALCSLPDDSLPDCPSDTPPDDQEDALPEDALPGCRVVLHGLKQQADLNGACGILGVLDQGMGQWHITLENGQAMHVKPDNVRLAQAYTQTERDAIERWSEFGGGEFELVLKSGAVSLLSANYLIDLCKEGGVLQPRQSLTPGAFLAAHDVRVLHAECYFFLLVVAVSHCWLQPDHPDPHGYNLRLIGRALQLLCEEFEADFGVFLDFCSIYQCCRDADGTPQSRTFKWLEAENRFAEGAIGRLESEDKLFKEALGSLGSLYSHPYTFVFMLTGFPPDYDDPNSYARSGNCNPYFERGWCYCESSWAFMVKDSRLVVDLGKHSGADDWQYFSYHCRQGRKAPVTPQQFVELLEHKGFTNGNTDRPRVAGLYAAAFHERFSSVTKLDYNNLGWRAAEATALNEVLASGALAKLRSLQIDGNELGDDGARALLEGLAPGALPGLSDLNLAGNGISMDGARALLEVLAAGALPNLSILYIESNGIGNEQAMALRVGLALGSLPNLTIDFDHWGDVW